MPEEMKLSSCPFCRGNAGVYSHGPGHASVHCLECYVRSWGRSEAEAVAAWNRRTPEPGTSVVRWVKYNGAPETLPRRLRNCLFMRPFCHGMMIRFLAEGERGWIDADGIHVDLDVQTGDIWAYLPEPPEGSHAL